MNIDQSISSHTQFIKDMIINQGYSINEFSTFLASKKNQGNFLKNWSLDELLDIAEQFKVHHRPLDNFNPQIFNLENSQNVQPRNRHQQTDEEEQKDFQIFEPQNQILRESVQNQESSYRNSTTYCVERYQRTQSQNIQNIHDPNKYLGQKFCHKQDVQLDIKGVQFIRYESIKKKLLDKSFILYTIQLFPSKVEISHRYSNFNLLREYLIQSYPEFIIPLIPKKTTKNPDIRMTMLERFMNRILSQIEFKADLMVQTFLTNIDANNFKRSIKDAFKQKREVDIQKMSNPQGLLNLQISSSIDSYLGQVKQNVNKQETLLRKIRKQTKKIMITNSILQNDMVDLANLFSSLYYNNDQANQFLNEKKCVKAAGVNIVLNNLFLKWSVKIGQQNILFKKHILDFYKFDKHEQIILSDKISKLNEIKFEVNAIVKDLDEKKRFLFQEGDVSKWQLYPGTLNQYGRHELLRNQKLALHVMLPLKTIDIMNKRDNFAYINNKIFEQVLMVHETGANEIAANIISFGQSMAGLFEGEGFWQDINRAMKLSGIEAQQFPLNLNYPQQVGVY